MFLNKKIKAIRLEEKLTQVEFCQLIDIPVISIQNYEREIRSPSGDNLMKIVNHPQFEKYALWFVTGKTAPESGQICPAFSIQEQCGITVNKEEKRA